MLKHTKVLTFFLFLFQKYYDIMGVILSLFLLLSSFISTYLVIPKIIKIVSHKKLLDKPNSRSSHKAVTPTLGGVSFFITIVLSLVFLKRSDVDHVSLNLVVGLTVLFIIGLKDDLLALSARVKAIAQILAISLLFFDNEFLVVESLHGFLSFESVNYWVYLFSIYFSMFFIINSFNLIDGIDGLASSIGILIFTTFGLCFYYLNYYYYSYLCIVLIGCLLAFLNYNFSDKKKIFMGDTGSMIIGFVIAMLTFKLLTLNNSVDKINVLPENLPVLLLSIITIPLLDTVRVFIVRTLNGKSFFLADRNHIHHIFVDLGLSHKRATFMITTINVAFIVVIYMLSSTFNSFYLFFVYVILCILFYISLYYIRQRRKLKSLNKIAKFILSVFIK